MQQQGEQLLRKLNTALVTASRSSFISPRRADGCVGGSCWCCNTAESGKAVLALLKDVNAAVGHDLIQELQSFGSAVAVQLPTPICCNNPSCESVLSSSELDLVVTAQGVESLCSGCKPAAYCGTGCQKAHWKAHKLVCSSFDKKSSKKGEKDGKKSTKSGDQKSDASIGSTGNTGKQQQGHIAEIKAAPVMLPATAAELSGMNVKELKLLCKQLGVAGVATAVEKQDLVQLLVQHLKL